MPSYTMLYNMGEWPEYYCNSNKRKMEQSKTLCVQNQCIFSLLHAVLRTTFTLSLHCVLYPLHA